MPRRRAVNGPTVTQLLTRASVNAPWNIQFGRTGPLPAIGPIAYTRPVGFLSGSSLASLSGVGPALPAQFLTRTIPATSGILNANAAANIGAATDAASRAWQAVKSRIFG